MSLRSRVARWLSPAPTAWASFSKLMQINGPPLLKEAIRDTAVRRLNADERDAIKRIESLRNALDCYDAQITFLDFGAGSPQDSRSETEMTHGVKTTRTVGTISRSASSTPAWGMFMYQLVRKYRPRS